MVRNSPIAEDTLLEETFQALRDRLPPGWCLTEQREQFPIDGSLALADPQGLIANIIVEAKARPVEAQQVSILADRWGRVLLPRIQKPGGLTAMPSSW